MLEWKQLGSAADLKDLIVRMMGEFHSSRQLLYELRGIYQKMPGAGTAGRRSAAQEGVALPSPVEPDPGKRARIANFKSRRPT